MFRDFPDKSGFDTGVSEPANAQLWAAVDENTRLGYGHSILERLSGRWSYFLDCDFAGYGPVMEARGVADHRLLYGGRYLVMQTSAQGQGQSVDFLSILAFNRLTDQFTYTVFEKEAVGPLVIQGRWDEASMAIQGEGFMSNPILGTTHRVWASWRLISPERMHFSMEVPGQRGERLQSCQVVYELIGHPA